MARLVLTPQTRWRSHRSLIRQPRIVYSGHMMAPRITSRSASREAPEVQKVKVCGQTHAPDTSGWRRGGESHCQFHHNFKVCLDSADAVAIAQRDGLFGRPREVSCGRTMAPRLTSSVLAEQL